MTSPRPLASCVFALVAFALLLVSACGTDTVGLAASCNLNSDCNDPLVCVSRFCHKQCKVARDCARGELCVRIDGQQVCQLPSEAKCTVTNDCAGGLVCAPDKTCRMSCTVSVECIEQQVCAQGFCANPDEDASAGSVDAGPTEAGPAEEGGTNVQPPEAGATCNDQVKNGSETDVDCGGGCAPCPNGRACTAGSDCSSAACVTSRCVSAACADGVKNGSESDVDCGGSCVACGAGRTCAQPADCKSQTCSNASCVASCTDGEKNGTESDVDCGGSCSKCAAGARCAGATDCAGGVCTSGQCVASCTDGQRNGSESDVDCGGTCDACPAGKVCQAVSDCASGVCAQGRCGTPGCSDGAKNGTETGTDCGGACGPCAAGQGCLGNGDCSSNVCAQGTCAASSCSDGVKNGTEADTDCGGGACPGCANGSVCRATSDCASNLCTSNVCVAASCTDGLKNGLETDIDCGGDVCSGCATGKPCLAARDCTSGVCTGGFCAAPTCTDGVRNGGELGVDCQGPCSAACLTTLAITPLNSSISVGTPVQYTAGATFSDNTTRIVTNLVAWSSSNTQVATISNVDGSRGQVTTLNTGTTTIRADYLGATTSTTLSVVAPIAYVYGGGTPSSIGGPGGTPITCGSGTACGSANPWTIPASTRLGKLIMSAQAHVRIPSTVQIDEISVDAASDLQVSGTVNGLQKLTISNQSTVLLTGSLQVESINIQNATYTQRGSANATSMVMSGGTYIADRPVIFGSFDLNSGTLTATGFANTVNGTAWATGPDVGNGKLSVEVLGRMRIGSTAVITMDQKGYRGAIVHPSCHPGGSVAGPGLPGQSSPNGGGGGCMPPSYGAGGSYGSVGEGGGSAGVPYGRDDYWITMHLGSGGGAGQNRFGGAGGGAIKISAATFENAGLITSFGGQASSNYGGGGTGGTIYIVTGSFSNTGRITAIGNNDHEGQGGGNGRIGVTYVTTYAPGTISPAITCTNLPNRPRCEN